MTDKLMHISNNDTQNYPFCRLQLMIVTLWHSTKIQEKTLKLLLTAVIIKLWVPCYNKTLVTWLAAILTRPSGTDGQDGPKNWTHSTIQASLQIRGTQRGVRLGLK